MRRFLLVASMLAVRCAGAADGPAPPPVTVREDRGAYVLENGRMTARVDPRSGELAALRWDGLDLLGDGRGYWSQVGGATRLGGRRSSSVRLDPATNGGERVEVACVFGYDGRFGTLPADVELRYALARGDDALYVSAVWRHPAGYPAFSLGEARFAVKLNAQMFDHLAVDADRSRLLPSGADWDRGERLNLDEARRMVTGVRAGEAEHKYDYSAVLFDTPAYGWFSTRRGVGLWLVQPACEYLAGGATKVELTGHLDANPGGRPTLLNMWLGSHYGGSALAVASTERWERVIGPFLLYANRGGDPEAGRRDALARARREAAAWPYAWAADPAYPPAAARGAAAGRVTLDDPAAPGAACSNLLVGLAAPDYPARRPGPGFPSAVDWQRDGKFYQHWVRAGRDGAFVIPHARPGVYALHAIADGVLGELTVSNIVVAAGATQDLGRLVWRPARAGRTVWEIGVPDRTAREFRHGDRYWQWGLYLQYPREFPEDVRFVIGRSDRRTDWNYCQPPRIEGRRIRSTTWAVAFELPEAPRGRATLRLAIAGSRAPRGIEVGVNGAPVGGTGPLPDTGTMHRDGIRGYWCERAVAFDAARLRAGTNELTLRVPADSWVQGVLYDYLRLELDEVK